MSKIANMTTPNAAADLLDKVDSHYATLLADPPWEFQNRTGKMGLSIDVSFAIQPWI